MSRGFGLLAGCLAGLLIATAASASPITPQYATFGPLPAATFGGSGIPNDWVAITTISNAGNDITLGLTATARYSNRPVTNDGSATFFADAGGDFLDPLHFAPSLARWNFDFYVSQSGGTYNYDLLYDFDPAAGTDQSALGKITFPTANGSVTGQDSWNLGFPFLAGGANPPAFLPFDPSAAGEYSFALIAHDLTGAEIGRSAILVDTVPEPASMVLLGTGLVGLVARRRKKVSAE